MADDLTNFKFTVRMFLIGSGLCCVTARDPRLSFAFFRPVLNII